MLWTELTDIAQSMTEPWCLLGDFNTILYKDDWIGGDDVSKKDIRELTQFMELCEITEMRSTGPYFSRTNKTIWSRIDRSLINGYWHAEFNFTQTRYDAIGLSDHTLLPYNFLVL